MRTNLDINCLRTFVTIIDSGNFAKAADRIGRTSSAVSLQIKRLEEQLGCRLFRRAGRQMVPSHEGERLLNAARQILELNDQTLESLGHRNLCGEVTFGAIQDIADTILPAILRHLSHAHPNIGIKVKVDRTKSLTEVVDKGELDLAVGVQVRSNPPHQRLRYERVVWWCNKDFEIKNDGPVPLVVFEPPCSFRDAAINTLNGAQREWEIVYTSPSLSGLRAAVQAGLGVTARAEMSFSVEQNDLMQITKLPQLPSIEFALYQQRNLSDAARRLRSIIEDALAQPHQ